MRNWTDRKYHIKVQYKKHNLGTWINVPRDLISTVLQVTLNPMVDEITIEEDVAPNLFNMTSSEILEYLKSKGE